MLHAALAGDVSSMAHEGNSRRWLRPTFEHILAMIMLCCLTPAMQAYNLRKALYKSRQSVDLTTGYQGEILFGNLFEEGQNGARPNADQPSSVDDAGSYQADSPGGLDLLFHYLFMPL